MLVANHRVISRPAYRTVSLRKLRLIPTRAVPNPSSVFMRGQDHFEPEACRSSCIMLQLTLSSVVVGGCGRVGNSLALFVTSTTFATMTVRQAVGGTRSSSAGADVEDDQTADVGLASCPSVGGCVVKVSIFGAAFLAIGLFFASGPPATAWPTGSYAQNCNGCVVIGNSTVIRCNCQRTNGTWGSTSINFGSCPRQSLRNDGGTLQCGK
jgi:hypothetical protein